MFDAFAVSDLIKNVLLHSFHSLTEETNYNLCEISMVQPTCSSCCVPVELCKMAQCAGLQIGLNAVVDLSFFLFCPSFPRHCVAGMGLGKGHGQDLSVSGEVDDNSLSPEACYDCKINGYPKRGRKRRSANETDALDTEVTL